MIQNTQLLLLILLTLFACKNSSDNTSNKTLPPITSKINVIDTIPTPEGYILLDKVEGDLDKDDIPEIVIVYDTGQEKEFGRGRFHS